MPPPLATASLLSPPPRHSRLSGGELGASIVIRRRSRRVGGDGGAEETRQVAFSEPGAFRTYRITRGGSDDSGGWRRRRRGRGRQKRGGMRRYCHCSVTPSAASPAPASAAASAPAAAPAAAHCPAVFSTDPVCRPVSDPAGAWDTADCLPGSDGTAQGSSGDESESDGFGRLSRRVQRGSEGVLWGRLEASTSLSAGYHPVVIPTLRPVSSVTLPPPPSPIGTSRRITSDPPPPRRADQQLSSRELLYPLPALPRSDDGGFIRQPDEFGTPRGRRLVTGLFVLATSRSTCALNERVT